MSQSSNSRFGTSACRGILIVVALAVPTVGCGHNQVVRQLQSENDRLLAEFRAEREQKLQLSEKLAATQARLAESEKLVARQNPLPNSRISRVEPTVPTFGGVSSTNSGQTNPSRNLPVNASPSDLQWRPMNKSR